MPLCIENKPGAAPNCRGRSVSTSSSAISAASTASLRASSSISVPRRGSVGGDEQLSLKRSAGVRRIYMMICSRSRTGLVFRTILTHFASTPFGKESKRSSDESNVTVSESALCFEHEKEAELELLCSRFLTTPALPCPALPSNGWSVSLLLSQNFY